MADTELQQLQKRVKTLEAELKAAQGKLTAYRRSTRFVWEDLEHYRALCRAGLAAHVPESITVQMTTNPGWQFKPSAIDGVFVLDVPKQQICVHSDHLKGVGHG